jgi:hypothetical protein
MELGDPIIVHINCQFSQPVNYQGQPPLAGEPFQFNLMTCSDPYNLYYEDGQGQGFFLDSRISYGDLFVVTFLLLFLGIIIWKAVVDFILPKTIKPLRKGDI